MNAFATWNSSASAISFSTIIPINNYHSQKLSLPPNKFSFQFGALPFSYIPNKSFILHARKRRSEPPLSPTIIEEVSLDDGEDPLLDNFEDEEYMDDDGDYSEEEFEADDAELYVGDGGGGGGISLAGMWWDKNALEVAEEVCLSFDGDLKIYAFKTLLNSTIQVRIERLSNRSSSPSMEDIEAFSKTYRARLDEAELDKSIPDNVSLEVSSPGVERVVRIPHELDRFKDRPMFVKYVSDIAATGFSSESEGVFRLVSFDMVTKCCTWGLADVRINREKAGKGRPLSKKQREWRLSTPFDSLHLVRLYSEI